MARKSFLFSFLIVGVIGFGCSIDASEIHHENLEEVAHLTSEPQPTVTTRSNYIAGQVLDLGQPVAGATVRIQTTDISTFTDTSGRFIFSADVLGEVPFNLTAWAKGFFCAGPVSAEVGDLEIEIELHAHSDSDNQDYAWLPSRYHPGEGESQGCAECHSRIGTDFPFSLPVNEWLLDAHANSAQNPRFLTMYYGTDVHGNQSPLTGRGFNRDYGSFPLRPDPSVPYFGPKYKLDFPDSAGNCAACHLPAAAIDNAYGIDPASVTGVASEGVPCDFCHKIWDVNLDEQTGFPLENMPGVLSYEFRRPPEGDQFFAGPLDDVAPGEDTFLPLQTERQFCAPCHFARFWDTLIYNSFGEWLDSPYSDPESGKTCQDCHMPTTGASQFATEEAGGLSRDPTQIFSHLMPEAMDKAFIAAGLSLDVKVGRELDEIHVKVELVNDNTGHFIPTDSPLRNLLLVVIASTEDGETLTLVEGPRLPEWAGVGDPEEGYLAGIPGVGYALILEELWTEISRTGAYWNPTRVVSDDRLRPFEVDSSEFVFDASGETNVKIGVQLIFRRAFIDLRDLKGWDIPDLVIAEVNRTTP